MNHEKFKEQQDRFLFHYPGGFENSEMLAIAKKHNIPKWVKYVKEQLTPDVFEDHTLAVERFSKVIVGSTLVSVFEKTAYKNMINAMGIEEKQSLSNSVCEMLHGDQQSGFEAFCHHLARYKNAKWPTVTALLYYSNPEIEVLIKPSTVKAALIYFEEEGLKYVSKPEYAFYSQFRSWVKELKEKSVEELQIENGAFCGFLMFAVGKFE